MTQLNIIGGAYKHPSLPTNNQRCLNCYPTPVGEGGRGKATLLQRAGKRLLTTITGVREVRGMLAVNNVIYVVADDKLYVLLYNTAHNTITSTTHVGTINDLYGPVSMAANTNQVIIVNGTSSGWIYSLNTYVSVTRGPIGGGGGDTYNLTINGHAIYTNEDVSTALTDSALITQINLNTDLTGVTAALNGTGVITLTNDSSGVITVGESGTNFSSVTDGLTISTGNLATGTISSFNEITDSDFVGGSSVVFLDGYFFIAEPDSNRFYASAINDGLTYNGLDFASAEINQNNIKSLAVKNRQLWIYKDNYVEVWYDAANVTGMPLSPRVGSEISIGTIATHSVVSIDNTLYWLDNRGFIVSAISSDSVTNQTTGNTSRTVSTDAMHIEFATYQQLNNAVAIGYVERGHLMYQINFPTDQKSWTLDINTGEWHERSMFNSAQDTQAADLAYFAVQIENKFIVSGPVTSGKLYFVDPDHYYDGTEYILAQRTTPHIFDDFNLMGIDQLEIKCAAGTAPVTGAGSDPYVGMRYSIDSGHTWSAERAESLGTTGQYGKRIQWNRLGTGPEFLFEFNIVAPIAWSIVDATITVSETEQY